MSQKNGRYSNPSDAKEKNTGSNVWKLGTQFFRFKEKKGNNPDHHEDVSSVIYRDSWGLN